VGGHRVIVGVLELLAGARPCCPGAAASSGIAPSWSGEELASTPGQRADRVAAGV
jgi:hypothetical protein